MPILRKGLKLDRSKITRERFPLPELGIDPATGEEFFVWLRALTKSEAQRFYGELPQSRLDDADPAAGNLALQAIRIDYELLATTICDETGQPIYTGDETATPPLTGGQEVERDLDVVQQSIIRMVKTVLRLTGQPGSDGQPRDRQKN